MPFRRRPLRQADQAGRTPPGIGEFSLGEVRDHRGSRGRSVALPELVAVDPVAGREVQRTVDVAQNGRIRALVVVRYDSRNHGHDGPLFQVRDGQRESPWLPLCGPPCSNKPGPSRSGHESPRGKTQICPVTIDRSVLRFNFLVKNTIHGHDHRCPLTSRCVERESVKIGSTKNMAGLLSALRHHHR